ncbi:hypothetical protein FOLKNPGA_00148 [Legionella sp. PC1000]|uniref:hypothetical protein n=1 Tax=Legionella sp. PC1000 TaxID=2746060 RepID=UPI0015FB8322|nr:hypothetical protein [Legionella sp. PC1000]QLZ67383.1 hypothetical protein FOLKNPGA_00148 [Legionella sp. PC1000]
MSNEKDEITKPKPKLKDPDPVPQKPQVIAPSIEESKQKETKGDEEDNKNKAQPEEPKKTTPQKEGSDKKKDPHQELLETLEKLVADINGSINKALEDGAKKGWDKLKQTEVGQAAGRLTDAITAKKDELVQQVKDKAGEKLDAVTKSISETTVGKAVGEFTDKIGSFPDMVSKGLTDAINKAAKSIEDSMQKKGPEKDETQTLEMQSPSGTKTDKNVMSDTSSKLESIDFDKITEKPPTPSSPEKEKELTDSIQLNT